MEKTLQEKGDPMPGGKNASSSLRFNFRKAIPSVLLSLLILLHFSRTWLHPMAVSAATPPPQLQVTFIPDIQPLDVSQSTPVPLIPESPDLQQGITSITESQHDVLPPAFISVQPVVGTTEMGYAYEIRDNQSFIHLWRDGQVIVLNALDPEAYSLIELHKVYTGEYMTNMRNIRLDRMALYIQGGLEVLGGAALGLTGAAAAITCIGAVLGGVTAPACAVAVLLGAVQAGIFAVETVGLGLNMAVYFNMKAKQRALLHQADAVIQSLKEISYRREEELNE
jgi:hypothetical protein